MHRFAKTDLHLHLDGSLSPETILALARRQNIPLPADTPLALAPYLQVSPDCASLSQYLTCFQLPLSLLQSAWALQYATCALIETLGRQGLTYAEIRFAPQLHGRAGLSQAQAVEAVLAGAQEGQARAAVQAGVILCMMTTGRDVDNAETVRLALKYPGVCAVDLAGQEDAQPMQTYEALLAPARAAGLPITLHAGEAGSYRNVERAIALGARRIGHGTRVAGAMAVIRQLKARDIVLEQCVTSNIQTQCVADYRSHPIRRLFDAGVKIAICTDNMTVSGTTLAQEYALLRDRYGFREHELAVLAEYARQARFCGDCAV